VVPIRDSELVAICETVEGALWGFQDWVEKWKGFGPRDVPATLRGRRQKPLLLSVSGGRKKEPGS
jgi:hypothetical protein